MRIRVENAAPMLFITNEYRGTPVPVWGDWKEGIIRTSPMYTPCYGLDMV
jgi:hypothetical protein